MKKLILLLILIIPLFAIGQLKQGVGFEYLQYNRIKVVNPTTDQATYFEKGDFAILYKLQYAVKSFKIESLASLYMNKTKGDFTFSPSHSDFTVSVSYAIGKLKIKGQHTCYHPILTDHDRNNVRMYGAQTKIGIHYNFD